MRSNSRLNAKTLSATLKYLENAGVVQRTVVSTRPFSVVYSLTEMGLGLAPATRELRAWGERWVLPRLKGKAANAAATGPPSRSPALAAPSAGSTPLGRNALSEACFSPPPSVPQIARARMLLLHTTPRVPPYIAKERRHRVSRVRGDLHPCIFQRLP